MAILRSGPYSLPARPAGQTFESDEPTLVIETFEDGEISGEGISAAFTSERKSAGTRPYAPCDRVVLDSVSGSNRSWILLDDSGSNWMIRNTNGGVVEVQNIYAGTVKQHSEEDVIAEVDASDLTVFDRD